MSSGLDLSDIKRRMNGALDNLRSEFKGLRTGRASVNLLDPVMVDAYGAQMPISSGWYCLDTGSKNDHCQCMG